MTFIVGVNCVEGTNCLLRRPESKHALTIGQERTWPRVLHHDWLAAGQITHGAIAYPRILKFHARTLGATEFATRLLNISLVNLRRGSDVARVTDAPAALFHFLPFFQVPRAFQEQSEFQGLAGPLRQIGIFQKRDALRVLILFSPVNDPV